tara:strand:+ start:4780 stop:5139 length:360 start_codon:yes stop_codon:yes gene_type:complete
MSGNYGGNSLPTTPIVGTVLLSGNITTYKDWKCTTALDGVAFEYAGVLITMPTDGSTVEMVISPPSLSAVDGDVIFLCYECGCENPVVSPVMITSGDTNYKNYGPNNKPIIIGGGGLNS